MSEKVWKKFIKDIKILIPSIDMTVLNKLKSTFIEMPDHFFKSVKCTSLIADTLKIIKENRLKAYIHLLDFKKSLKAIKRMKRSRVKTIDEVEIKKSRQDQIVKTESNHMTVPENESQVNSAESVNHSINGIESDIKETENFSDNSAKIEKYIAKLENVLQATKIQIEKLEEQELSLDDLDSEMSAFVMLDKLKTHYVKVWKKVSKLRNTKSNLRKRYLKSFSFTGSIYPEMNKNIENFVKLKKFPDFNDIKNLVLTYMKNNSIDINSQKISDLTIDIFTQIGNKLKKLRIAEFVQYFGNHLTDQAKSEKDPIFYDDNLRKILQDNYIEGENKIDEVLEKFSRLQQNMTVPDISQNTNNSDISTEYSSDSENENAEELLEEILLQPIGNLCETDGIDNVGKNKMSIESSCVPIGMNAIQLEENNLHTNNENKDSQDKSYMSNVILHDQFLPVVSDSFKKILSEEYINEISSTTFQFNIDQMKNHDSCKYYKEIIVLNSDAESDDSTNSGSSEDVIDVDNAHYAYSTKLDDFIISNLKPRRKEIKEIIINLDEDTDDDVEILIPETI